MPTPSVQIIEVDGVLCKKCGTCKKLKPLTDYSADKSKNCGYDSRCKECGKSRCKRWYNGDVERERLRAKLWRTNNQERYRNYVKRYMRSIEGGFSYLKYQAKKRDLECDFTLESYREVMSPDCCHYCQGKLNETGARLDRMRSDVGYLVSNCVPCCLPCNLIRGEDNISYEEMIEVAKLLKKLRDSSRRPCGCHNTELCIHAS